MDNIEYVLEDTKEEVAAFIIENNTNTATQDDLIRLIKNSGIDLASDNDLELKIEENNGVKRMVIYRHEKKNVPYKTERIALARLAVDSKLSREEQIKRAELMKQLLASEVGDNTNYEITEEKSDNGDTTAIIINQIKRTPLTNNALLNQIYSNEDIISNLKEETPKTKEEEYIINLQEYLKDNNMTIKEYYYQLGTEYRNNHSYVPPEFERNNPFLKVEDLNLLLESKDDRITEFFANSMSRVIELNLESMEEKIINNNSQDENLSKVLVYNDVDNNYEKYINNSTIKDFDIEPISGEIYIEGDPCYRIANKDIDKIKENIEKDKIEIKNVHLGDKNDIYNPYRGMERFIFYQDINDENKVYVLKYALTRFNLNQTGPEVIIDGKVYSPVDKSQIAKVKDNQHNSYSPYIVEIRDLKKEDIEEKEDTEENELTIDYQKQKPIEHVLYRAVDDNNKTLAPKKVLDNFHITPTEEPITVEGEDVYPIDEDTENHINDLAKIKQNPEEIVRYQDVQVKEKEEKKPEEKEEEKQDDEPVKQEEDTIEYINLFRYLTEDGTKRIFAPVNIFEKFNLEPTGDIKLVRKTKCYELTEEHQEIINEIVNNSKNPTLKIRYIDIKKKKKKTEEEQPIEEPPTNEPPTEEPPIEEQEERVQPKPHLEAIIYKLTQGLHLTTKSSKRFRASNIKVSSMGKDIFTGNWLYNVVSAVPGIVKMPIMAIRKLVSKIMLKKEDKEDIEELQRRLNEELTEEELEVLFQEYRGSQAKMDMNPQINDFITDRIRVYILNKVDNINQIIKVIYAQLFNYIAQIKSIDEKLEDRDLTEDGRNICLNQRKQLVKLAASCAKAIDEQRKTGIELLSGNGLHGFEEDMKAVSSKMSYVGYRFAKSKEFDNETQVLLARYGQGFNNAIANGDDEAIIENFINLEACYSDNTEIRKSILGKRSVGSKYYSPLVEELNYRDDPFIRNLFSTIALTSAAVSAANAFYTHKIAVNGQQAEINRVNSANEDMIGKVHQTGQNIESHRGEMIDGMNSNLRHSTTEVANDLERSALDTSANGGDWNLNSAYSATDTANHTFYNNYYDSIINQLNTVTNRYSNGAIDQAQALQEITKIANDSQKSLNTVVNDCLTALRPYASSHPEIDLHSVEESMEYIVNNPEAIINMNNGIVDMLDQASTLSELNATYINSLAGLPSDLLTTIIGATAATALAVHTSTTMNHHFGNNYDYGNEVTDMMDKYLDSMIDNYDDEEDYDDTALYDDIEDESIRIR